MGISKEGGAHLVDFTTKVNNELLTNGFDLAVAGDQFAADRGGLRPKRRV